MTETIQRVRLDELTTIRVVCQDAKCGASIEVPLAKAAKGLRDVKCPGCARSLSFGDEKGADHYAAMALAMSELVSFQQYFAVEFLVRSE